MKCQPEDLLPPEAVPHIAEEGPLKHLIPDHETAGRAWARKHGGVPINHLAVMRESIVKAWIVPRLILAAASPRVDVNRCAISPAALLVNVNAQMRAGSKWARSMRK